MPSPLAGWRRPAQDPPPAPGPVLVVSRESNRLVVKVRRPLDSITALILRKTVAAAVKTTVHPALVEIDLREVPWVSHTGLSVLRELLQRGIGVRADAIVAGASTGENTRPDAPLESR